MMQPLEILLQRTRALPKDADGEDCNESVNHSRVFLSVVPVCLQVHSRPDISFAVHQCVLDIRFIRNDEERQMKHKLADISRENVRTKE